MASFNPTIAITLAPQTAALLDRVAANLDTANQLLSENEKLLSSVIANELAVQVAPDLSQDPPYNDNAILIETLSQRIAQEMKRDNAK